LDSVPELVLEEHNIYPDQWTQLAPGVFTYTYMLNNSADKAIFLSVDSTPIGRLDVTNVGPAPTIFDTLNYVSPAMVGQPISLQLNSSATDFASISSSNTGWRVGLIKPDKSRVDLGFMANWGVWSGIVYKWNMTVPGNQLIQVRQTWCQEARACHA
jgi:hypothetical protein